MKKILFSILVTIITLSIFAQDNFNLVVIDETIDEEIILGYCDRDGLTANPFNSWFETEFEAYAIDQQTLDLINVNLLEQIEIKIVLGTWCTDSQREIPRYYKIIDYLEFDNHNLIAVNRQKLADETEVDDLNIEFVPTFIFYNNGEEIGRIIESPNESLEKDIFNIISNL